MSVPPVTSSIVQVCVFFRFGDWPREHWCREVESFFFLHVFQFMQGVKFLQSHKQKIQQELAQVSSTATKIEEATKDKDNQLAQLEVTIKIGEARVAELGEQLQDAQSKLHAVVASRDRLRETVRLAEEQTAALRTQLGGVLDCSDSLSEVRSFLREALGYVNRFSAPEVPSHKVFESISNQVDLPDPMIISRSTHVIEETNRVISSIHKETAAPEADNQVGSRKRGSAKASNKPKKVAKVSAS